MLLCLVNCLFCQIILKGKQDLNIKPSTNIQKPDRVKLISFCLWASDKRQWCYEAERKSQYFCAIEQSLAQPNYLDLSFPCHLISAASLPQARWARKYVTYLCHYVPIFLKLTVHVSVPLWSVILLKLACRRQRGNISGRINKIQGHSLPNCCSLTPKHL